MALPEEFLQELRDKNDITDVVSSYVNLKRAGRLYSGRCPFHSEKNPLFLCVPRHPVVLLLWLWNRRRGYNLYKKNRKFRLHRGRKTVGTALWYGYAAGFL